MTEPINISDSKHKILILGPQGSGKGTQAQLLAEKLGLPALSMGQLLRDEVCSESILGQKIKDIIDQGELVSDDIALDVLKIRIQKQDAEDGYILDGYPRNLAQYQTFKNFDVPTALIVITVPKEETLKRLLKRAEIEGRSDDNKETILKRLDIYHQDTEPIIEEYRKIGIVKEIDGIGTVEEVASRICQVLNI
ncbi:adenylate kinase [Patescibacteria group bacterium]|nr:adenylate kinase [Patescibacteria group bacterium]MBU4452704.1 adenylate kinase [Patescibacteria group bacterium]MCG2687602.1 adenylate kinase [Candidatus Parcubacteria bacterium]